MVVLTTPLHHTITKHLQVRRKALDQANLRHAAAARDKNNGGLASGPAPLGVRQPDIWRETGINSEAEDCLVGEIPTLEAAAGSITMLGKEVQGPLLHRLHQLLLRVATRAPASGLLAEGEVSAVYLAGVGLQCAVLLHRTAYMHNVISHFRRVTASTQQL